MNDIDKLRTVHKSNETSFEYVHSGLYNPMFQEK